jgi:hypothetical protein
LSHLLLPIFHFLPHHSYFSYSKDKGQKNIYCQAQNKVCGYTNVKEEAEGWREEKDMQERRRKRLLTQP